MPTASKQVILVIFSISGFIMIFQNCGEGFSPTVNTIAGSSVSGDDSGDDNTPNPPSEPVTPNPPITPTPPTGLLVDFGLGRVERDCLASSSTDFNACVFYKNPTFQAGQKLSPPVALNYDEFFNDNTVDLRGLYDHSNSVTYAVKIPGTSLANSSFIIQSGLVTTSPSGGKWKFGTTGDDIFHLGNVNLYYWLNRQAIEVEQLHGNFYAKNKAITVRSTIVSSNNNGQISKFLNASWAGLTTNQFYFGFSASHGKVNNFDIRGLNSLSSEVAAHEAGHANLDYATMTGVPSNPNLEASCGTSGRCAKSKDGSPKAIHEGTADIHAFLLFPESTSIGEYFTNNIAGFNHCGTVPRDMKLAKTAGLKAQDFYNACSSMPGEIHALGSAYSTIWYGILVRAKAKGQTSYNNAQNLFYEHLKNITTNDTFLTAKDMILSLDSSLFSGQLASDIQAEYTAMGY